MEVNRTEPPSSSARLPCFIVCLCFVFAASGYYNKLSEVLPRANVLKRFTSVIWEFLL